MELSADKPHSGNLAQIRVTASGIVVTIVLLAAFGLSFVSGTNVKVAVLAAAVFFFFVLVTRNPSWIVHALLIVTFTTLPLGSANAAPATGVWIGGRFYIEYYEFFVLGALLYAVWLLSTVPVAALRLRHCAAVPAAALFGVVVVGGLVVGLLRDYPTRDIQTDARPLLGMLAVIFIAAVIFAADDWRRYLKTITAILLFSAVYTIYGSVTGQYLGLRTEAASLYDDRSGEVLSGGSDTLRALS